VDLIVLAGDIGMGKKGREWITSAYPESRVIYVAGNHEYYGHTIPQLTRRLEAQSDIRLRILECQTVDIEGVRFFGCTLWSDLAVEGDTAPGP
jgi:predicted phosphohydrolase